jgi:hypothetical protein
MRKTVLVAKGNMKEVYEKIQLLKEKYGNITLKDMGASHVDISVS